MADKFQKDKFVRIPENTFNDIITRPGVVLTNFDIENLSYTDEDFLCATSGGIKIKSSTEMTDNGEDVDNVKKNTKELTELKSRTHEITFTSISANKKMLNRTIVASDWDETDSTKLRLRTYLENRDFAPLWVVYPKANGGVLVAHFPDTLSTGGLDFGSSSDGKGTFSCTFTAYSSLLTQDVDAVEYYLVDPPLASSGAETPSRESGIDNAEIG